VLHRDGGFGVVRVARAYFVEGAGTSNKKGSGRS
jgi:hypothetical protein